MLLSVCWVPGPEWHFRYHVSMLRCGPVHAPGVSVFALLVPLSGVELLPGWSSCLYGPLVVKYMNAKCRHTESELLAVFQLIG